MKKIPTVDTQRKMRTESRRSTAENQWHTEGGSESRQKKEQTVREARNNLQHGNNKCFPVGNDFSVNGLNSPIKRHRVTEYIFFKYGSISDK